jgi:hypothetical protein
VRSGGLLLPRAAPGRTLVFPALHRLSPPARRPWRRWPPRSHPGPITTPRRQRVVEHYLRAAERLPERSLVPGPRVKAVVVPELHTLTILVTPAGYRDRHAGNAAISSWFSSSRTGHPVFEAHHLERMEQIVRDVRADFSPKVREFTSRPSNWPAGELPPTVAISRLVNTLNGVSSRRLRRSSTDLRRQTRARLPRHDRGCRVQQVDRRVGSTNAYPAAGAPQA